MTHSPGERPDPDSPEEPTLSEPPASARADAGEPASGQPGPTDRENGGGYVPV